jgi:hypothetical protein
MCVVGCAAILAQGVPGIGWFLLAACLAGLVLAAVLFNRRTVHHSAGALSRSLLGRA